MIISSLLPISKRGGSGTRLIWKKQTWKMYKYPTLEKWKQLYLTPSSDCHQLQISKRCKAHFDGKFFSQLPVLMKVCLWDGGLWWWFEYNLWWWSLMVVWMYSIIVLLGFHRWLRFQIGENGRQEIQPENVFLFLFWGRNHHLKVLHVFNWAIKKGNKKMWVAESEWQWKKRCNSIQTLEQQGLFSLANTNS